MVVDLVSGSVLKRCLRLPKMFLRLKFPMSVSLVLDELNDVEVGAWVTTNVPPDPLFVRICCAAAGPHSPSPTSSAASQNVPRIVSPSCSRQVLHSPFAQNERRED